jgi:hypothetical protein
MTGQIPKTANTPDTQRTPTAPRSGPNGPFIWNSTDPGNWAMDQAAWGSGEAPGSPSDQVIIIQSGTSNYNIDGPTSIGFPTD